MLTNLIGIRPAVERDGEWQKMKRAWDACTDAGAPIPESVRTFFGGEPPADDGSTISLERHIAVREVSASNQSGFEVDLTKLPADVKRLRFVNSW